MTRPAAMDALAKAVRTAIADWDRGGLMDVAPMRAALAALDAQPEAVGETVEVRAAVGISLDGRDWVIAGADDWTDEEARANVTEGDDWMFASIITARVPLPKVPVIPATVEVKG